MLTEDGRVGGLAVGKGIADSFLLPDTFLVGIHPTYTDRWYVHIHPTYVDTILDKIHHTYADR